MIQSPLIGLGSAKFTNVYMIRDLVSRVIIICREDGPRGVIHEDISVFFSNIFESVFIEIVNQSERNVIIGVIYRPNTEPQANIDILSSNIEDTMVTVQTEINKQGMIMGDYNVDLLHFESHAQINDFLEEIISHGVINVISKPNRITTPSATFLAIS